MTAPTLLTQPEHHGLVDGIEVDAQLLKRFWAKVEKTDGCWLWTASKYVSGYGQFNFYDRNRRAHRISYQLLVGPIPDGLVLDHLCRVPACVNPAHLEPVTVRTNTMRGVAPERVRARHQAVTHCPAGHAYDADNTYYAPNGKGKRACKKCQLAAGRRSRARRLAREAAL